MKEKLVSGLSTDDNPRRITVAVCFSMDCPQEKVARCHPFAQYTACADLSQKLDRKTRRSFIQISLARVGKYK